MNKDIDNFDTYLRFLSEIIDTDNKHYKEIFLTIVTEAQKLIKSRDIYSVSNERFAIVNLLASHQEIMDEIDIDEIKREDFKKIYSCLKKENEIHA